MAHPMMVKALRGVEAVRLLGETPPYFADDAAGRLYYALYHACWAFLQSADPPVPFDQSPRYKGQGNWYMHDKLEEKLRSHSKFSIAAGERWEQLLNRAKRYRRMADYASEGVEKRLIDDLAPKVEAAVNGLYVLLKGR